MSWNPPPPVLSDRAAGAVLASACGDALGAGHEFGPALAHDVKVAMVGGGTFDWAPGEWNCLTRRGASPTF